MNIKMSLFLHEKDQCFNTEGIRDQKLLEMVISRQLLSVHVVVQ